VASILELFEDGSSAGYGKGAVAGGGSTTSKDSWLDDYARRPDTRERIGPGRRYRVFEAAPQDARGMPAKKPMTDYFL